MRKDREREFRQWAHARRGHLRKAASLLCGDWHLADDLTQTTLTRVYLAWPRIKATEGPDGYAHRVLVNAFLDERRRPWRREESRGELPTSGTSDRTDAVVNRHVVRAALAALPPRQRAVIVLRFFEDLSIEQTAAAMSCSVGTVKSQTAKAYKHMEHLLTSQESTTPPTAANLEER